jgi:hypothetical protein
VCSETRPHRGAYDPGDDEPALIELVCSETRPHRPAASLTPKAMRTEIARAPYHGSGVLMVRVQAEEPYAAAHHMLA